MRRLFQLDTSLLAWASFFRLSIPSFDCAFICSGRGADQVIDGGKMAEREAGDIRRPC
jgi:hypothetical protein